MQIRFTNGIERAICRFGDSFLKEILTIDNDEILNVIKCSIIVNWLAEEKMKHKISMMACLAAVIVSGCTTPEPIVLCNAYGGEMHQITIDEGTIVESVVCPYGCAYGVCLPECSVDADCGAAKECINQTCVDVTCINDAGCPTGQVCENGICVLDICETDDDCGDMSVCRDGVCVDVECMSDEDCPDDAICDDGVCIEVECVDDSGCAAGERCEDGLCVSEDLCPGDPNKTQPGLCGCDFSDTDSNGNGIADYIEDNTMSCPEGTVAVKTTTDLSVCAKTISNAEEFKAFRDRWNAGKFDYDGIVLVNDININSKDWEPIEDFDGIFIGGCHEITNHVNNSRTALKAPLFRLAVTAQFLHLRVDMDSSANSLLVLEDLGGTIYKNIRLSGAVQGSNGVGSLIGYNDYSDRTLVLDHITSDVAIAGASDYNGGLIGYALSSLRVSNSAYNGQMTMCGGSSGGLIGAYNGESLNVEHFTTKAKIHCHGDRIGMVVGSVYLSMDASLDGIGEYRLLDIASRGSVVGNNSVGGIIGYLSGWYNYLEIPELHMDISNVYSASEILGDEGVGGVIGEINFTHAAFDSMFGVTNGYVTGAIVGDTWNAYIGIHPDNAGIYMGGLHVWNDYKNNDATDDYSNKSFYYNTNGEAVLEGTKEKLVDVLNQTLADPHYSESLSGGKPWTTSSYKLPDGSIVRTPVLDI